MQVVSGVGKQISIPRPQFTPGQSTEESLSDTNLQGSATENPDTEDTHSSANDTDTSLPNLILNAQRQSGTNVCYAHGKWKNTLCDFPCMKLAHSY